MPSRSNGKDSPGNGSNGRRYAGKKTSTADWISVDASLLRRVVAALAKEGGATRFGYTRDGGAYAIGIYGDGDPYTIYVGPGDDIEGELRALCETFEG